MKKRIENIAGYQSSDFMLSYNVKKQKFEFTYLYIFEIKGKKVTVMSGETLKSSHFAPYEMVYEGQKYVNLTLKEVKALLNIVREAA